MACNEKTKTGVQKVEVKEVTFYSVEDDFPPPPPNLTSNFKTLQEWLLSICNGKKPEKSIATFHFGLFESSDEKIMFLTGVNKYINGDTSYTRIEFEPSNVYYQLPQREYSNLNRDQLMKKLTDQLKAFTNTEKFNTSFLSKANAITFESNGQTIWSK